MTINKYKFKSMAHEQVAGKSASRSLLISQPWYENMMQTLNTVWHERSLQLFMAIVLAHWAEHLVQAYQIYVMGWPIPESLGVVGYWFPWLFKSEILHYGYAIVMLVCLWILRTGFTGSAYTWWMVSFWIQFWHHIEHFVLQIELIGHLPCHIVHIVCCKLIGYNMFGAPVPMSFAQFFIPRVELHLIYNTLVFIPMIVGMYLHMFPPPGEEAHIKCSCVVQPKSASK